MWLTRDPGFVECGFPVEPHLQHPSGLVVAWFTEPPGAVVQLTKPARGTLDLAQWLVGPACQELLQRFPDAKELFIVFDLSQMRGRDLSARAALLERAKTLRPGMVRAAVIPPAAASALYLSSLRVAVAILGVFGVAVDIESSLKSVIASRGLNVAGPSIHPTWRFFGPPTGDRRPPVYRPRSRSSSWR
jgi:hypothetical protein